MPKKNNSQEPKINFPQMEESVLKFWRNNKIFEKSVEKEAPKGDYVFYDGPPFATGLPHYGHIVASAMKDVIPRFKTMQGYRVERQWGWDCHGLPVENLVEKALNLKTKKDIEDMGVDKFNDACCNSVMRYADEWKKFIPRIGRWVDMENDYKTMNPEYMESIWWVFKSLWDRGMIYKGYKNMHLCPRCETTLSNFEVTQGYKDVKDLSVVVKFKLKAGQTIVSFDPDDITAGAGSAEDKYLVDNNTYILAWTTTPWTLPGNAALAVGENIDYFLVKRVNWSKKKLTGITEYENLIIAKNIFDNLAQNEFLSKAFGHFERIKEGEQLSKPPKAFREFKGKKLVGLEYESLFSYFDNEKTENKENGWKIYAGDFVSTEDGTGIVHIAPAFGEDDMNLGKKHNLPFIQHVKTNGRFVDEVKDFAGMEVKPKEDPSKTDIEIIEWLERNDKSFSKEKYTHSYPHCWRCDTPLLNYSTSSWFVNVAKIKDKLLKNNKKTNWVPEHIRDGRFGKWLEGARDWAISRSRYWGAPLPVWKCENKSKVKSQKSKAGCGHVRVIGSIEELEKLSGQKVEDLHKQFVDKIELKCEKCGGAMARVPEVLDCWFESGSMPYAQKHYMGKPLDDFDPETGKNFPAEFIAEGMDQTRGWFYTLMVLSAALFDKPPFVNVIVNGIVLAEDGQKMSKRLKNYPDPNELIGKYGADAMRYYLISSPVVKGGDLNFSEKGVDEVFKKVIMLLWNVYSFYETYAPQLKDKSEKLKIKSENILDKWILAKLDLLIREITENLEKYDLQKASRPILEFINELSTWYLRRSRDRFKFGDEKDKQNVLRTTNYVLLTLSKLMAPFTPFIAESLYQKVKGKRSEESVHLAEWPNVELRIKNEELKVIDNMKLARQIVEQGLSARANAGIKIRQPLSGYTTSLVKNGDISNMLIDIIKDELNIKELKFGKDKLDIKITTELRIEGHAREIVRAINLLRKDAGLFINDTAEIYYNDNIEIKKVFKEHGKDIMRDTLCTKHETADMDQIEVKKKVKIGEEKVFVGIVK